MAVKILKKHRAIIQSSNNITSQQRKAFNALLYFAKEQLEKNPEKDRFTCSSTELRKIISDKQIKRDEIKKSLKDLMKILIEFNILEDEKFKSWYAIVLLAQVEIKDNGDIEFIFPPLIKENILKPDIFCPLDLKIVSQLDAKSSIAIYEFCKDYIKVEVPKLEIEVFKKMLGLDTSYSRPYDLKRRVLEVAKKEINEKTDIEIEYDLISKGRTTTHIKFYAKKKEENEEFHIVEYKKEKNKHKLNDTEFLTEIMSLISEHEILTTKETSELKELTSKYGKEIIISNIKYTNRQNYQNYYVYLRKAITEDYAEKDRKINEMKAEERKAYELKVKQEEAEASQREVQRKQAIRIYQTLPDNEREAVEEQAAAELEKIEGINNVRHLKLVFENMKLNKIIELIVRKYLNKTTNIEQ